MADVDPALGQEILDVAQRQRLFHTYIITNRGITFGEMLKYRNGRSWPDATTAKDGARNWSDRASVTFVLGLGIIHRRRRRSLTGDNGRSL
jgi:hypothetical protein